MARFDEDVPELSEAGICAYCREPLYVGDEVRRIDDGGGYVHDGGVYGDCAEKYAFERVYDVKGVVTVGGNVE
jgi:hypothetical protein